jgi:hypothetical protein
MVDPAAATFANIDDICVNMLRDGKKSETLEYLRRCVIRQPQILAGPRGMPSIRHALRTRTHGFWLFQAG